MWLAGCSWSLHSRHLPDQQHPAAVRLPAEHDDPVRHFVLPKTFPAVSDQLLIFPSQLLHAAGAEQSRPLDVGLLDATESTRTGSHTDRRPIIRPGDRPPRGETSARTPGNKVEHFWTDSCTPPVESWRRGGDRHSVQNAAKPNAPWGGGIPLDAGSEDPHSRSVSGKAGQMGGTCAIGLGDATNEARRQPQGSCVTWAAVSLPLTLCRFVPVKESGSAHSLSSADAEAHSSLCRLLR